MHLVFMVYLVLLIEHFSAVIDLTVFIIIVLLNLYAIVPSCSSLKKLKVTKIIDFILYTHD